MHKIVVIVEKVKKGIPIPTAGKNLSVRGIGKHITHKMGKKNSPGEVCRWHV